MATLGRLAVDFGTSNTVIAAWDDARQEGLPLDIPDYGRQLKQGGEQICIIPSLIHYSPEGRRWVGQQVAEKGLYGDRNTFRWMKRYIANRSPVRLRVGERQVSYQQAGADFLSSLLVFTGQEQDLAGSEVALTVPVEAFEDYENWLAETAASASLPRFRLIDEPSAAALGYGAPIRPGDVYLIFDFGGGTLDVSAILIEPQEDARSGRHCRVLGKAGLDLGGVSIDQWLFQELLRQNHASDADEDIRPISRLLLVECERIKERLSYEERADLQLETPGRAPIQAEFTQSQLEELLDQHEAFTGIDRTVRRALNAAAERGYAEQDIKAVLMVGGSSQIPSVQRALRRIFGRERVMLNRPLDAIARGAAAFVAGVDFYDHIQHDYAIRHVSREKAGYDYRLLVPRGTPYPTPDPVARLTVKATYDGQTRLGIAIFELSEARRLQPEQRLELVFDPSGSARLRQLTPEEEEQRSRFWMNEGNPTFLQAEPAAEEGQACFDVEFRVDENKRLVVTARDIRSERTVLRDFPVVRLV